MPSENSIRLGPSFFVLGGIATAYPNLGHKFTNLAWKFVDATGLLAARGDPTHTQKVSRHQTLWRMASPRANERLSLKVQGVCMEPLLRDGQVVEVCHGKPLPGDIVAVAETHRTRVHRYLGPAPTFEGGRLRFRLLTCADDTEHCDPLAHPDTLVGIVAARIEPRDRALSLFRWSREVARRTSAKVRGVLR